MCRGADLHLLKQLSIETHIRLMFYLCRDQGPGEGHFEGQGTLHTFVRP